MPVEGIGGRTSFPLLAQLHESDAAALAEGATARRYQAGSFIAREGESGDTLHTVLDGSVRIAVTAADGSEATLAVLGPGDSFGELSLLDGRPRSASAIAIEPSRTLVVTRAAFERWLDQRPRAARDLLAALSLRLRETDALLADFTFCGLPQRMARSLMRLAGTQLRSGGGGAEPRVTITQAALATMLGVSRESVNKELTALAEAGWVRRGRGTVTLTDVAALRSLAESGPVAPAQE